MKAGLVKCPECGEGLKDVAPDYELDPTQVEADSRGSSFGSAIVNQHIEAHCLNGHLVWIHWEREPGRGHDQLEVKSWPKEES